MYQQPPTSSLSDALENFLKVTRRHISTAAFSRSNFHCWKHFYTHFLHISCKPNVRSVQPVLQAEELSPGVSKTVRLCIAKVTQEIYFKKISILSDNTWYSMHQYSLKKALCVCGFEFCCVHFQGLFLKVHLTRGGLKFKLHIKSLDLFFETTTVQLCTAKNVPE